MAQEIVARFHSQQAAEDALADFVNRSKGGIPDDIPEVALAARRWASAAAQAGRPVRLHLGSMRMVEQGGVRVDGTVISDKALKLEAGTFVLQVGKRKFARVTLSA
jgi:tyrosyl-tRNA synthetase